MTKWDISKLTDKHDHHIYMFQIACNSLLCNKIIFFNLQMCISFPALQQVCDIIQRPMKWSAILRAFCMTFREDTTETDGPIIIL